MANDNLIGRGHDVNTAGVRGENSDKGPAVHGESIDGRGVQGFSTNNYGIRAHSELIAGLRASSTKAHGVEGWAIVGAGVKGISKQAAGVHGISETTGMGVIGESKNGNGVFGFSDSAVGVAAQSNTGRAVQGMSNTWQGVYGHSNLNAGVVGESDQFDGVFGVSRNPAHAGVSGHNFNGAGQPNVGGLAGFFEGNVIATGTVTALNFCLSGADFAEDFFVEEQAEPGDLMVLSDDGSLTVSAKQYDKKLIGVISGAGNYKPGIILDKQPDAENRKPIAMMGKVYCKAEALSAPIEAGDMLTTSNIAGCAMKADDPFKAFGAIIGKALAPLHAGTGLIPIFVTLR